MNPPTELVASHPILVSFDGGPCLGQAKRAKLQHQRHHNSCDADRAESEFAMRMSRSTAYAIRAILQLGNAPLNQPVPCSHLAKTGEMPERFLLQILRNLVNHGILKSTRGVDGGYALSRPLTEITLLQVFEATEGPLTPALPPLDNLPATSQQRLLQVLSDITAVSCQGLDAVKLSDIFVPQKTEPHRKPTESEKVLRDEANEPPHDS